MKFFIVLAFAVFGLFGVGCTHSDSFTETSPYKVHTIIDEIGFGSSTRTEVVDTTVGVDDCAASNLDVLGVAARANCLAQATALAQGRGTMMQQGYGLGLVPMMPNVGGPVTIIGGQTMSPQQSAWSNTNGTVGLVETSPSGGVGGGNGYQAEVNKNSVAELQRLGRSVKKLNKKVFGAAQ